MVWSWLRYPASLIFFSRLFSKKRLKGSQISATLRQPLALNSTIYVRKGPQREIGLIDCFGNTLGGWIVLSIRCDRPSVAKSKKSCWLYLCLYKPENLPRISDPFSTVHTDNPVTPVLKGGRKKKRLQFWTRNILHYGYYVGVTGRLSRWKRLTLSLSAT